MPDARFYCTLRKLMEMQENGGNAVPKAGDTVKFFSHAASKGEQIGVGTLSEKAQLSYKRVDAHGKPHGPTSLGGNVNGWAHCSLWRGDQELATLQQLKDRFLQAAGAAAAPQEEPHVPGDQSSDDENLGARMPAATTAVPLGFLPPPPAEFEEAGASERALAGGFVVIDDPFMSYKISTAVTELQQQPERRGRLETSLVARLAKRGIHPVSTHMNWLDAVLEALFSADALEAEDARRDLRFRAVARLAEANDHRRAVEADKEDINDADVKALMRQFNADLTIIARKNSSSPCAAQTMRIGTDDSPAITHVLLVQRHKPVGARGGQRQLEVDIMHKPNVPKHAPPGLHGIHVRDPEDPQPDQMWHVRRDPKYEAVVLCDFVTKDGNTMVRDPNCGSYFVLRHRGDVHARQPQLDDDEEVIGGGGGGGGGGNGGSGDSDICGMQPMVVLLHDALRRLLKSFMALNAHAGGSGNGNGGGTEVAAVTAVRAEMTAMWGDELAATVLTNVLLVGTPKQGKSVVASAVAQHGMPSDPTHYKQSAASAPAKIVVSVVDGQGLSMDDCEAIANAGVKLINTLDERQEVIKGRTNYNTMTVLGAQGGDSTTALATCTRSSGPNGPTVLRIKWKPLAEVEAVLQEARKIISRRFGPGAAKPQLVVGERGLREQEVVQAAIYLLGKDKTRELLQTLAGHEVDFVVHRSSLRETVESLSAGNVMLTSPMYCALSSYGMVERSSIKLPCEHLEDRQTGLRVALHDLPGICSSEPQHTRVTVTALRTHLQRAVAAEDSRMRSGVLIWHVVNRSTITEEVVRALEDAGAFEQMILNPGAVRMVVVLPTDKESQQTTEQQLDAIVKRVRSAVKKRYKQIFNRAVAGRLNAQEITPDKAKDIVSNLVKNVRFVTVEDHPDKIEAMLNGDRSQVKLEQLLAELRGFSVYRREQALLRVWGELARRTAHSAHTQLLWSRIFEDSTEFDPEPLRKLIRELRRLVLDNMLTFVDTIKTQMEKTVKQVQLTLEGLAKQCNEQRIRTITNSNKKLPPDLAEFVDSECRRYLLKSDRYLGRELKKEYVAATVEADGTVKNNFTTRGVPKMLLGPLMTSEQHGTVFTTITKDAKDIVNQGRPGVLKWLKERLAQLTGSSTTQRAVEDALLHDLDKQLRAFEETANGSMHAWLSNGYRATIYGGMLVELENMRKKTKLKARSRKKHQSINQHRINLMCSKVSSMATVVVRNVVAELRDKLDKDVVKAFEHALLAALDAFVENWLEPLHAIGPQGADAATVQRFKHSYVEACQLLQQLNAVLTTGLTVESAAEFKTLQALLEEWYDTTEGERAFVKQALCPEVALFATNNGHGSPRGAKRPWEDDEGAQETKGNEA
ncbi:hypothetical protein JKP88DRAFT_255539 [Tribonema minus]|uniref:Uncharacterized protein n=1 Tax=Tribonema minus TaxID=303371 RepID=A0A836CG31_9STRA|nr:hypothetical protein JKP88DRAFT_255539 [Tribonema minus]